MDELVGSGYLFIILPLSMSGIMCSWEVFSSFYGDNDFLKRHFSLSLVSCYFGKILSSSKRPQFQAILEILKAGFWKRLIDFKGSFADMSRADKFTGGFFGDMESNLLYLFICRHIYESPKQNFYTHCANCCMSNKWKSSPFPVNVCTR